VDFCARLSDAGFRIRFEPAASARHEGAHSISTLPLEIREKYWYGSLLKYAAKRYRSSAFRTVCLAVAAGAAIRAVREFPRIGLRSFAVYSPVCRLAIGRLFGAGRG
jgi:GT2 family glycosyltransferase